ncbi:hypothetical protein V2G26_001432 [Clonostachys chloroleuca]
MHDIYKYAQRVIAWLGTTDEHSPIAISMLQEIADCVDFTNEEDDILKYLITFKPDKVDFIIPGWKQGTNDWSKPLPFSRRQWQAVISLISRSWFRRLWVRQEVLLAGKNNHHDGWWRQHALGALHDRHRDY